MSNNASARWKQAKLATAGLNVTRNFRTLREMGAGGGVPFDQLEFVSVLGGATSSQCAPRSCGMFSRKMLRNLFSAQHCTDPGILYHTYSSLHADSGCRTFLCLMHMLLQLKALSRLPTLAHAVHKCTVTHSE